MRTKPDKITIISWNCNGISNKKEELRALVEENHPDVILLQETMLKYGKPFNLSNYHTYRKDRRNKQGGGVAVLVKKEIMHHPLPPNNEESKAEGIGIEIKRKNNESISIYSTYIPPGNSPIKKYLDELQKSNGKTLVAGDLNAKNTDWNCKTTNSRGKALGRYSENRNIQIIAPSEETHSCRGKADILDIAINKNITESISIDVIDDTTSDHHPVKIIIAGESTKRKIYTHDWEKFKESIESRTVTTEIKNAVQLEQEVSDLEMIIKTSLEESTSEKELEVKIIKLPEDIRNLINLKKMARKEYHRTLDPKHKTIINKLNNMIKKELKELYYKKWNATLDNLTEENQPPWKLAKTLIKENRTNSLLKQNDLIITSDKDKSKIFADILAEQFKPN